MSFYKAQHLADVVKKYGNAAGTDEIVALLTKGFEERSAQRDAERALEKGADHQLNPYFTDADKCERAIYLSLTGAEKEPFDIHSLTNFAIGNAIQDVVSALLKDAVGAEIFEELSLEFDVGGVRVSGRLDIAIVLPELKMLMEVKAINNRSMASMLKRGIPGREAHRKQANLYVHGSKKGLLKEHFDTEFDVAYLVYVVLGATKGEPVFHAFPVVYNPDVAEQDLAWLALVAQKAEAGMDPGIPAGFTRSKFPCSYCNFKRHCYG